MLLILDITDLLIYLDEGLTKNLNSLIINGYIERRTSKWIEDRTISAGVDFTDKDLYFQEDRQMKDERDCYKGKSYNNACNTTEGKENRQNLDGRRFCRREEELTRIYTSFELHSQLMNSLIDSNLLKSVTGDWRNNQDLKVGDYIEITGTISSESVLSYLDVFYDAVNCIGISEMKKYCTCDEKILNNFQLVFKQMEHLNTLLTSNDTKDLIIKTEGNDVVVIVNNKNFFDTYSNIFDEVECPCKVIGKIVKICSKNEHIHLLRKTGQPQFYENLLNCCCDIGNNINDSGIILPSQPKCKGEGETILIIPISVCI